MDLSLASESSVQLIVRVFAVGSKVCVGELTLLPLPYPAHLCMQSWCSVMPLGQTAVYSQSPEPAAVCRKRKSGSLEAGRTFPCCPLPRSNRLTSSLSPLCPPHPASLRKFQVLFLLLGEITVNDHYGQPGFANSAPVGGLGVGSWVYNLFLGTIPSRSLACQGLVST